MGLTTWNNAPRGQIRKTDVSIAKNYLTPAELDNLNRIVSMYLDYAELQAKTAKLMYMKDWISKLDAFLQFNDMDILNNSGAISAEIVKTFAEEEFEKYRFDENMLFESDYDKYAKSLLKITNN